MVWSQARAIIEQALPQLDSMDQELNFELNLQHFIELLRDTDGAQAQLEALHFARRELHSKSAANEEQSARLVVCHPLLCCLS